jgi:hypothetical protein
MGSSWLRIGTGGGRAMELISCKIQDLDAKVLSIKYVDFSLSSQGR